MCVCVRNDYDKKKKFFFFILTPYRGFDSADELNSAFIFDRIEALHERETFKRVYNRCTRNVRKFLYDNELLNDWEFFEISVANPFNVDLLNWIFDLLIEQPEAVKQFTGNPFSAEPDAADEMCDVIGEKINPSYAMQLRIFYRWISQELYILSRWVNR